jgi:hypothetical protein
VAEELKLMPITADRRAEQYHRSNNPFQQESVSRALKQRDGELLVCDVSLYRQLYQAHLDKSGGNQKIARQYTYEAVKKDGVSLMQENISALSIGGTPIFDLESRARMQLTPTVNTYLLHQEEIFNPATSQIEINKKMVSPEHAYIGRSVTQALTQWRRGNDASSMAQNERLFTDFEKHFDITKTHTLVWGSPMAKESEGPLIHKYNGEYGYLYVGEITHEAGVRKMVVHSYKNDLSLKSYQQFIDGFEGTKFYAGDTDQTTPQTVEVDRLMRTSLMIQGSISPKDVYKQLFKIKTAVEGIDTLFGIDEKTLLSVQDPHLRQKLENEASSDVATWLINQLERGASDNEIQDQVKNQYIVATRKTIERYKVEKAIRETKEYQVSADIIVDEDVVDLKALAAMKATSGAFCGKWGKGASQFEGSTQKIENSLKNLTTFSGFGWGGEKRSSSDKAKCNDCGGEEFGECGFCIRCFPE